MSERKPLDIQIVGENNNEIMIVDEKNGRLVPADACKYGLQVSVTKIPRLLWNHKRRAKADEKFVFAKLKPDTRFCPDLDFATLFRLVVLATYSSYSTDERDSYLVNDLPTRAHRPMTKKEMQNILGLKKSTFDRFLNDVCHVTSNGEVKQDCFDTNGAIKNNIVNYLYQSDGKWYLNSDCFIKGTLVRGQESYVNRIFVESIRKLYRAVKQSQHKALGMILSLMPYINKHWNVICANPLEEDPERIMPLNARDICKVLGLSAHNAGVTVGRLAKVAGREELYGRLYKTLLDLELPINGIPQLFCVLHFEKNDCPIVVNPNCIFVGDEKQKEAIFDANQGFDKRWVSFMRGRQILADDSKKSE